MKTENSEIDVVTASTSKIKYLLEIFDFEHALAAIAESAAKHTGAAIVCTSELSPNQIERARANKRLVVRYDGIGFALIFGWEKGK